jgi:hypothetical protein
MDCNEKGLDIENSISSISVLLRLFCKTRNNE